MPGLEQYQAQKQQLALSSQMQQGLRILQAPVTELRRIVNAELAANPLLEEMPPENAPDSGEMPAEGENWTAEDQEKRQYFFDSRAREQTLTEFLEQQLVSENSDPRQQMAIRVALGSLDRSGYFRGDLADVAQAGGITPDELEWALKKIQLLDPPGIGAKDLAECLLLQLDRQGRGDSLEARIIRDHLEDLALRRIPKIAERLGVSAATVREAAAKIQELDPRPGAAFAPSENHEIRADVIVTPEDGDFRVELNEEGIPRLRITPEYRDMTGLGSGSRGLRDFLRGKIREGRFLINSLQERQQTLLAVSQEIVTRQRAFLERGPEALVPMTMSGIASALDLHETTIGRTVSGKYMATPQGLFELKYFFTSGYVTEDGASISSESIRHAIREMIRSEPPGAPLDDQALTEALAEQGIPISRRTVAKYRDQLGILPAEQRGAF